MNEHTDNLVKNLRDISILAQKYKDAADSRLLEINNELNEANFQLSELDSQMSEAEAMGQDTAKKQLQKKETELLTRQSLLRQKQENISSETTILLQRKLLALVPLIPDAEKERKEYDRDKREKLAAIDKEIKDLQAKRIILGSKRHPLFEAWHSIERLEKAAKLEKGKIKHSVDSLNAPAVKKNPFFGSFSRAVGKSE